MRVADLVDASIELKYLKNFLLRELLRKMGTVHRLTKYSEIDTRVTHV